MTFGSLFAGIGGFDLGLERAGMECRWQVEIDPYCQKVLAKHWPSVKRYGDIRTVGGNELERVDLICGGFPCQDISNAGKRAGIDGGRSGLWSEYSRIVGELRPRYVLVENVAALLGRGMGRVLGDLAALGYDAEWEIISAADVGAPHLRERVWVLAYTHRQPSSVNGADSISGSAPGQNQGDGHKWKRLESPDAENADWGRPDGTKNEGRGYAKAGGLGQHVRGFQYWLVEPAVGRVANGVPSRVDRLKSLGNAVVPQIPEWIGRRIMDSEARATGLEDCKECEAKDGK